MPEILDSPKTGKSAKANNQPKYLVLAGQFRERIRSNELKVGDRLPTFAEMREKFGVTLGTVERTYSFLEQEGLIERQQGRGTFVADQKRVLTGNIGFIGSAIAYEHKSPFSTYLMEGIRQAMGATQQNLLCLDVNWEVNCMAGEQCCEYIDGLLCNLENPFHLLQALPARLPRVSLLNVVEGMTSVVIDDYRSAKTAVGYLQNLGHRRIACLMEEIPSLARRRFAGYRDAMAEAGMDAAPGWARLAESAIKAYKTQHYFQWGRHQMSLWLEEGFGKLGCTALFVQNETAAIGVMQVLQEEGWKVPEDISVMGFDGTELCDYVAPRLTAMESPLAQIGAKAVEMLNRQIAGETSEAQTITLPVNLHKGNSVMPPLSIKESLNAPNNGH